MTIKFARRGKNYPKPGKAGVKKLATVKTVKRMINNLTDKQLSSSSTAGGAIVQAGTVYLVDSGVGDLRFSHYELRFKVTNVTNTNNGVRFILFQFRDDSTPTTDDILGSSNILGQQLGINGDPHLSRNINILKDITVPMNLTDYSQRFFSFRVSGKRLRRPTVTKDGTLNRMYLLALSSDADTNTTLSTMYWQMSYYLN